MMKFPLTFEQWLNETKIGEIDKDMTYKVVVDKSYHAEDRQDRPESEKIADEDIVKSVDKAARKILYLMTMQRLEIGKQRVLVRDSSNDLNIVVGLQKTKTEKGETPLFVVVTAMKTKDFRNVGNTYAIDVK